MQASDSYEHAVLNDHEVAVIASLELQVQHPEEHRLVRGNALTASILTRWYAG